MAQTQINVKNFLQTAGVIHQAFVTHRDYYEGDFSTTIRAFLTLDDARVVVQKCNECTCCETHQTNRPVELALSRADYVWGRRSMGRSSEEKSCKCCCRNFSRWVVRAYGREEDKLECQYGCGYKAAHQEDINMHEAIGCPMWSNPAFIERVEREGNTFI